MSGLINKVKEAVTGHHADTTDTHGTTGTTGTTDTHGTTGTRGTTGTGTSTTGAGDHNYATTGPQSSTQGNYAVSGDPGYTPGSGTGAASGPHSSGLANKMDPRVDSDRDGHRGVLGSGTTGTTGTGVGTGAASGPHSSGLANKMDPRVDSDRDGRTGITGSTGTTGTGDNLILGTTPQGLVHGHHTTVTGEKLDPHIAPTGIGKDGGAVIDSNTTGMGGTTTSGPHNSNILNKLDPRVDSDRDGSSGLGGSRTHT